MMIRRRLSSVKCGTSLSLPWERRSALLTIRRIAILWQRKKNGNGTLAPLSATIIADQTHFWFTKYHEVLTKRGQSCGGGIKERRSHLSRASHARVMTDKQNTGV